MTESSLNKDLLKQRVKQRIEEIERNTQVIEHKTQVIKHNTQVSESMLDLIDQLDQHQSIIGRYRSLLLIDQPAVPTLLLDTLGKFLTCHMRRLDSPTQLPVFCNPLFAKTGNLTVIDASPILGLRIELFADQCPGLARLRMLIEEAFPYLPEDMTDYLDAAEKKRTNTLN